MAKTPSIRTAKVVRDAKSGRLVTVRGAGALKGRLGIEKGVDLTRPITSQVMKRSKERDENAGEGVLPKAAPTFAPTEVGAVHGSLPFAGEAKTVAEMNEAVAAEARRRARD